MTSSLRTHKIELNGIESDMQTSETVEYFGFDTRNGFRNSLKFECRWTPKTGAFKSEKSKNVKNLVKNLTIWHDFHLFQLKVFSIVAAYLMNTAFLLIVSITSYSR